MTAFMLEILQSPVARAIGIALLHFVWQASLIALVLAAVLGSIDRRSARLRYGISCAALALLVILPVRTALVSFVPAIEAPAATAIESEAPASLQVALVEGMKGALVELNRASTMRERLDAAGRSLVASTPWLVAFWLVGVTIFSMRFMSGLAAAHNLTRRDTAPVPEACLRAVRTLTARLGIRGNIRVVVSRRIDVPAVVGVLRPVVLVPLSALTGLSSAQLDTILAHELAHIRRHDFSINLAQSVVETLFFYHPAVWWISRQVRIEREHCCDDLAVSVCGNAAQYARALATLESVRSSVPTIAVAASGGSLLARVRRLAGIRSQRSAGDVAGLTAGVLAGIIALTLPAAFVAQQAFAASSMEREGTIVDVVAPRVDHQTIEPEKSCEKESRAEKARDKAKHGEPDYAYAYAYDADHDHEFDLDADFDFDFDDSHVAIATLASSVDLDASRHVLASLQAIPMVSLAQVMAAPPAPPAAGRIGVPAPPAPPAAGVSAVAPPSPVARIARTPHPAPTPGPTPRARNRNGNWNDLDVDELVALRAAGVTREYVLSLREAGLDIGFDEAIAFGALGVTPAYVREVRNAFGPDLDAEDIVGLKALGVSGDYVRSMREQFPDADSEEIVSMKAMGLTASEVQALRSAYPSLRDTEDIVAWKAVGVSPAWIREIAAAGFGDLDVEEAIAFRSVGVTGDWIRAMRDAGVQLSDSDEVVSMRALGVTAEYVRELREAGVSELDAEKLIELKAHGIDAEWIREIRQ